MPTGRVRQGQFVQSINGGLSMLFFPLAKLADDGLQTCVENPDAFAEACDSIAVPRAQLLARYATLGSTISS